MILFVDASAAVSMMTKEDDAYALADRADEARELIWSPMAVWESVAALARIRKYHVAIAHGEVWEFGRAWNIRQVSIGQDECEMAITAYEMYGKGSGHPAKLNMGDCFAYGCAKTHQAKLLYKGNDFIHTNLK